MKQIYLKTQTARTTSYKEKILNANMGITFQGYDFEIGLCSVQYWGDFKERKIPLVTLELEGVSYELELDKFIEILEKGGIEKINKGEL